ncbi:NADH-ubiquinone oxidoreductase-F iron-sulfur binding region domain-containing protein [Clostridium cochlearium]|uniref:NAD(P)-dependent iron-only hydrogenase diaphorase component flavoprotein n=1 Tax=Clostridium cochlearium TaxID=1494 RepID=A0A240ALP7_CLOCO|nr:NADH-ubiquinone oxidoreductase-F iron-sulfur binding region domain-containing protein [Clostridium cochlearium]NSJ90933.1 4Fe-4S binding protein [Coprococcus sp. MSK.21.13]MBE6064563.1 4Fe-4S dicluster domain-containing protein [Clostridium cochlearium]MBU5268485.1 SLBB domain-containing protein [Clostridium cochlearium]MCR1971535.1 NAD(P)H-dependent oxidoreductase subunit E [Clostridium cochlearium]NMA57194.1 4Fe-4S binding protein [Clostridium cochlearium]
MTKIKSFKELKDLHDKFKSLMKLKKTSPEAELAAENKRCPRYISICGGTGCKSSDSYKILENLKEGIKKAGLENEVQVSITGCFGFCEQGPIVHITPDNTFYVSVKPEDADEIIEKHLLKGEMIERLLYIEPTLQKKVKRQDEMSFYKKQYRIALRNCGVVNPEDIREAIAQDSYMALGKALTEMCPKDVIKTITDSRLRGRGGGGFPTGVKWGFAKKYDSPKKYIICNADEGDPGAFMDRSILEGDPHSVLSAMAIAGYAIGADEGNIYIRAEYPLAVQRLYKAIDEAHEYGLLGDNILGTNFSFKINIKYGAGAFVCGEETALIHSIEGERGEPTNKPPFPAESGLWGKPTCVNNVETLAIVPAILTKGIDWFKSIGTQTSSGTKVFALAGKVNNVGLVEVPMGTTLREIIYEIGGGIKNGRKFKAVQTGGPSGGCIPASHLDTEIDYESLTAIGSMMGSGGMIVMDEDNCMVDIAKFYLEFTVDESCGKCTPCRIGNKRLLEILTKITEGKGTEEDLIKLKELSQTIKDTSLCGLGQTAPNPILSTMKYFWDEYEAHVKEKRCPAGVCKNLLSYEITDSCIGCTKCARICPASCIDGKVKEKHTIIQDQCIKCGSCYSSCPVGAIIRK